MEPPPERLYRFVQWELPWELGPSDGRYLVREHAGEEPRYVLVLSTLAAPRRKFGVGRRTREVEPEPPGSEAGLTRATLVDTETVDADQASSWLDAAGEDVTAHALVRLNEAIRAYRAAAADPYLREVAARHALVTRVGYGIGYEVADGRWQSARELKPSKDEGTRRARRQAALRPQERLAALLSGRDAVLACEELILRARLDLDSNHPREAALQAHIALEAAIVELQAWRGLRDLGERLAELDAHRDALASAANEAIQGGPSPQAIEAVKTGLERLEAALRARSASAQY